MLSSLEFIKISRSEPDDRRTKEIFSTITVRRAAFTRCLYLARKSNCGAVASSPSSTRITRSYKGLQGSILTVMVPCFSAVLIDPGRPGALGAHSSSISTIWSAIMVTSLPNFPQTQLSKSIRRWNQLWKTRKIFLLWKVGAISDRFFILTLELLMAIFLRLVSAVQINNSKLLKTYKLTRRAKKSIMMITNAINNLSRNSKKKRRKWKRAS